MSTEPKTFQATAPDTGGPLLWFDHVVKDYSSDGERVRALDSVSLEIPAGEFIALSAEAGAGNPRCCIWRARWTFRPPDTCNWMALRLIDSAKQD